MVSLFEAVSLELLARPIGHRRTLRDAIAEQSAPVSEIRRRVGNVVQRSVTGSAGTTRLQTAKPLPTRFEFRYLYAPNKTYKFIYF